jgi:hypothetical protein
MKSFCAFFCFFSRARESPVGGWLDNGRRSERAPGNRYSVGHSGDPLLLVRGGVFLGEFGDGPSESVKLTLNLTKCYLTPAMIVVHASNEPFVTIRTTFSRGLWGQPTDVACERSRAHTLGESCEFTPSNPTHRRRLQDRRSLFRGTRRRVGRRAPGDQGGVDANGPTPS